MGFDRSLCGDVGLPLGTGGPGEVAFDLTGVGPFIARGVKGYQPRNTGPMTVDERIKGLPGVANLADQDYGGCCPASRSLWPSGGPGAFLERIRRVVMMIV